MDLSSVRRWGREKNRSVHSDLCVWSSLSAGSVGGGLGGGGGRGCGQRLSRRHTTRSQLRL